MDLTKSRILPYVLLIISAILLVMNLVMFDYSNFKWTSLFAPMSNILLMLTMIATIVRHRKEDAKEAKV